VFSAGVFARWVRVNRSTLSHNSVICSRSPEVSSIAFHAQPPDLPPVPLMDVGFAIICSLARNRPQIQFLSIASRVVAALLSDLASRLGPCASVTNPSLPSRWVEDFHLQAIETCSAHIKVAGHRPGHKTSLPYLSN
jgi:hypothetical protein